MSMGIVDLVGRGLGCERSGIVSLLRSFLTSSTSHAKMELFRSERSGPRLNTSRWAIEFSAVQMVHFRPLYQPVRYFAQRCQTTLASPKQQQFLVSTVLLSTV